MQTNLTNTNHLTLKMTSAQVVETSVTNNSSFQNYPHPDDHTIQTTDTPGFKPFTMLVVSLCRICRLISSDWLYHILDMLSHKLGICFADIVDAVYRSCYKILSLFLVQ